LFALKAKFVDGNIKLVDHDQWEWVHPKDLKEYEFAPADLKFVEQLVDNSPL
jgi:8-oxo-dGTP diphosphatase